LGPRTSKARRLALDAAAGLVLPRDSLLCGFVGGQATGFLEALGARDDLVEVVLYAGLLSRPYALLKSPGVRVVSGFFGPVERMARASGARVSYLPADFSGLERLALRLKPRVVVAVTAPPDPEGWLSFGVHAGASFRPFLEAARDPNRLAIAEVNPRMPRVAGLPEFGGHRIHLSEVDAWVEHDAELVALPPARPTPEDLAIARRVCELVQPAAVLQFGIGAIPDAIARILSEGPLGDFAIHTEMISDGVMRLHEAGKVTNRKPLYDGVSVATFALGGADLYRWLDGNASVRMLPVSEVNDASALARLPRLTSINGALSIDLAGQVAADWVGGRQYSGAGGHESFVSGAGASPGGRSFLCLKSTARVGGVRVSTIVPGFPEGARVTTPRHHVQYVVTEHGAVDLSALDDDERPLALIPLAHPDFRDSLRASSAGRDAV
jgi:acyl-CoA hydrolase